MLKLSLLLVPLVLLSDPANSFAPAPSARHLALRAKSGYNQPNSGIHHAPSFLRMAVTQAPPKVDNAVGGFFTNSSPETKRVVPTNMEGKTKFKIVYVVLESQYQSALTKACNNINNGKEGVAVEAVGYLLEELRNPAVFEQFKEDVANANIFIGSLIFIQELADKVSFRLFQSH